jgi:L-fucose mutarotase
MPFTLADAHASGRRSVLPACGMTPFACIFVVFTFVFCNFALERIVMLKLVSPVISPELMALMMQMGHGDEIVLADANFPADSHAQRIVRADGIDLETLLPAILKFLPVDTFVPEQALVMQPVDKSAPEPVIWAMFRKELQIAEDREVKLTPVERFAFYDRAREAYAIVSTGSRAFYSNIILKKGVVSPDAK